MTLAYPAVDVASRNSLFSEWQMEDLDFLQYANWSGQYFNGMVACCGRWFAFFDRPEHRFPASARHFRTPDAAMDAFERARLVKAADHIGKLAPKMGLEAARLAGDPAAIPVAIEDLPRSLWSFVAAIPELFGALRGYRREDGPRVARKRILAHCVKAFGRARGAALADNVMQMVAHLAELWWADRIGSTDRAGLAELISGLMFLSPVLTDIEGRDARTTLGDCLAALLAATKADAGDAHGQRTAEAFDDLAHAIGVVLGRGVPSSTIQHVLDRWAEATGCAVTLSEAA